MSKVKPINKRVAVEVFKADDVSDGGIIIPDMAKETPSDGIVIAISEDAEKVAVGDHIVFPKYEGTDIAVDGNSYRVLLEEKIICVIEK